MRNILGWLIIAIATSCAVATASPKIIPTQVPQFELQLDGALLVPEPNASIGDDFFLVHTGSQVRAHSVRDGRTLGTTSIEYENAPRWISGDRDHYVLGTFFEISGSRLKGEPPRWTIAKSERRDNPDPEDNNPIRQMIALEDQIIALFDDGQIQRIKEKSGALIWERMLVPKPVGGVAIAGGTMTYLARTERGETVQILHAGTGEQQSAFDLPTGDSVLDQFPGESTTVLRVADGFIGVHSQTGNQRWRIGGHSRLAEGHVAADSSGIYASVDGQQVVKFSRETGERVWRFEGVGIKAPVRVAMSVSGQSILIRGDGFAQVLDSTSGALLGRVECLSKERMYRVNLFGEAHWALVKPMRNESMWRLESSRLSRDSMENSNGKHYYLPPFPEFKEAVVIGDTFIVQDGHRVMGFKLPSDQPTDG
jgi:outer membrane protein assembly factor BamB